MRDRTEAEIRGTLESVALRMVHGEIPEGAVEFL